MTMGDSWSYVSNDRYKSAHRLIHLLVDIVSKGGNFLLNIGPNAEGELPTESMKRLKEIGAWMAVNSEAVYKTRPVAPYKEAKTCYTRLPDGTIFAIYLADENETHPPAEIMLYSHRPSPGAKIAMLGVPGALKWEPVGQGVLIHLPDGAVQNPPCREAWAFRISGK